MGRVVLRVGCLLPAVFVCGCATSYDCDDSCELMRDCNLLVGTSTETCEVVCTRREANNEDAIDECGECLDSNDCSPDCLDHCVCALSLDTMEYGGVVCMP